MSRIAKVAVALCVAMLAGCAGMQNVIERQDMLYAAKPFDAGSQQAAFNVAAKAARAHFETSISGEKAVPALIDAGISTANGKCRDWLRNVNEADLQWRAGEGNVSVWQGLAVGALGALGAHVDVFTVLGLGSAAWSAYNANFKATVLGMADYAKQAKMWEVMEARAHELRIQAPYMTWPDAIDRLEGYGRLCTVQAAEAAVRSSLNATTTRVSPGGTITSTGKQP